MRSSSWGRLLGLFFILLVICIAVLEGDVWAENPYVMTWTGQIGSSGHESAYGVAPADNEGVYVAGYTQGVLDGNAYAGGDDIFLAKYNSIGTKTWTRVAATANTEDALAVASDSGGNAYICGYTYGGLDGNTNLGGTDAFIIKYDPNGNKKWTRQFGTPDMDRANGIAVDGSGNVYAAGSTYAAMDGNVYYGNWDAFVVKYDPSGTRLWTRQLGTSGRDEAWCMAVDGAGNIYVAGTTDGSLDENINMGATDGFIAKYSPDGTKLWTREFGTLYTDTINGIAADANGNAYVTGYTGGGMDGNVKVGIFDLFLVKYDSAGNKIWTKQKGTANNFTYANAVATDNSGNIYLTGSASVIDGNASAGSTDFFTIKYAPNGTQLWSCLQGTVSADYGRGITVSLGGKVYIAGDTYGAMTGYANSGLDDFFVASLVSQEKTTPSSTITDPLFGAKMPASLGNYSIMGNAVDRSGTGLQKVEVSTDNGNSWNNATDLSGDSSLAIWGYRWSPLPLGNHTLKARATDNAGNVETGSAPVLVTVTVPDTPGSTITDPQNGAIIPSGLGNYNITGNAKDWSGTGLQQVEISTDNGSTWNNASDTTGNGSLSNWVYHWAPAPLGNHTLKSRATDNYGDVEVISTSVRVVVEDKPISKITDPLDGVAMPAALGSYSIIGYAADRGGGGLQKVEVTTDNGLTWNNATDLSGNGSLTSWVYHWAPLPLGNHTLRSRATDNLGKVETPDTAVQVMIDGSPPTSAISRPLPGALVGGGTTYSITGSASDFAGSGVVKVEVSTNGGSTWAVASGTNSWSYTWTLPVDGLYTIKSRATDRAGNIETSPPGVSVEVDKTPPTGSISINSDAAYTTSATVTLTLSAKDVSATRTCADTYPIMCGVTDMEFSSNNSTWGAWETAATTKSWQLATGDGNKSVYVKFRDAAGNVSVSYSKSITLDATPPIAAITSPANGATLTNTACTVSGTASDATSGLKKVELSTDGGTTWSLLAGTTSWTYNWTVPAAGAFSIACKATDNAGNEKTVTASVTAKSTVTVNRTGIVINYNKVRPAPITKVKLTSKPWSLTGSPISTTSWLKVPATADAPGDMVVTVDPAGLAMQSYTGTVMFSSPYSSTGQVKVPFSMTVSSPAINSELQHYNWNAVIKNRSCNNCHDTRNVFLPAGFNLLDSDAYCWSCHNLTANAHERTALRNMHPVLVNVTSGGCRMPTYGNITASETSNQLFANLKGGNKIVCNTCHNSMKKKEDYGRAWELTTTQDGYTFYLNGGGWSNYGTLVPTVYRSLFGIISAPVYDNMKKSYRMDPSSYTYDEVAGSITFKAQQQSNWSIFVTLDYPYLRASSEGNRLCTDCHTEATHKSNNCLTCHQAHSTDNLAGIRGSVRTADLTVKPVKLTNYTGVGSFADGDATYDGICEVCHTKTKYYRRDGTGFVNHSGGVNYSGKDCTACHGHAGGFAR